METEQRPNEKSKAGDDWPINRLLLVGFLIRILVIFYAGIHDYMFKVKFTDIDYTVYSDAALHVYNGRSPFMRATYRYSPILAYMVLPNVFYSDFGKFLFSAIDILTGWLLYLNGVKFTTNSKLFAQFKSGLCVFWLFNPFIAIISSRGNADTIVCSCIALVLYLIAENQIVLAAIVHGMLAIHLRIYPIIYLPSIFFNFGRISTKNPVKNIIQKSVFNVYGFIYCLVCMVAFLTTVAGCYHFYGQQFLDEYLLYHIRRQDVKHNFSPYFYPIYLTMNDPQLASVLSFGAFIPQLVCILYFAMRYSDDLPFCWFVTTFMFVALNKVCTSQYFVWYLMYLPLICYKTNMCSSKAVKLIVLWFLGQGLWLLPAYLLEMQGPMVLYLIGLGLGGVEDITVRGLKIVKQCEKVYLESYTSILSHGYGVDKKQLEEFYGREVLEADRTFVEQQCDEMIADAKNADVALLVVGDPFGATTHSDLALRAKDNGTEVQVVHNASILNAVGCCGLQLYLFGEVVSITFWTDEWRPNSFYDKIARNRERGLHTLCLLDIKVKEQTVENMMRGRQIFEPPRFLTCTAAAQQLLEIVQTRRESGESSAFDESTKVVGLARVGWPNQKIAYCSLAEMAEIDMGSPLHSLIIPGNLHSLEEEMLQKFSD